MKKQLRLIFHFAQLLWQNEAQNRLGAVSWVVNGMVTPLLTMAIWLVIGSQGRLAMNSSQLVTYYILMMLVGRITQVWSIETIGERIRDGRFSFRLLKPYSYTTEEWGFTFGLKAMRLVVIIPALVILTFVLRLSISLHLPFTSILFVIGALALGLTIRFYLENLVAMFVFWTEDSYSLNMLHSLAREALSGELIPLALAPAFFVPFMTYSPFRYAISFPLELALGQLDTGSIATGFLIGAAFLLLLIASHRFFYHHGLKKYGAFGS